MCETFNKNIHKNIKKIMEEKKISTYSLEKAKKANRNTLKDKIGRLNHGLGISTTSLYEISVLLDVPVDSLIEFVDDEK